MSAMKNQTLRWMAAGVAVFGLRGQAAAEVNVSISSVFGSPGDTVLATIVMDDATAIAGADLSIALPAFALPADARTTLLTAGFLVASRPQPGQIDIAMAQAQGLPHARGTILQIPVRIGGTAFPGTYPVSFAQLQLYDGSPAPVASHANAGSLTVLPPPEDQDGDGLPDEWESRFLGNVGEAGETDTDHDGVSNYQEYIAGTDPASADSVFRIAKLDSQVHGGEKTVLLEWAMQEGRDYQVYWSDGPLGPAMVWHEVYHPLLQKDGAKCTWLDDGTRTYGLPADATLRFYRVVADKPAPQ